MEREAHKGAPFGGRHRKNTYASETPATDGERLYVYFGNVGLFAYSLDGKLLWTTRFDPQPMYLDFRHRGIAGGARRPRLRRARQRRQIIVAAVDAKTGKHLWPMERDIKAPQGSGWSVALHLGAEGTDSADRNAQSAPRTHRHSAGNTRSRTTRSTAGSSGGCAG
jgi:hypothetical protein